MTKIWSTLSCRVGGASWAWAGQLSKTMRWRHSQVRFWTLPSEEVMEKLRVEEEVMAVETGSSECSSGEG